MRTRPTRSQGFLWVVLALAGAGLTLAQAQPRTRTAPSGARPAPPPPPPAPSATPAPAPGATTAEPSLPGEVEAMRECKKYPRHKRFKWELRGEVDLMNLLNAMAPMLCRPFIVPGNIRQNKVTIIAPDTMTAPEAYRMFLSSIETMGLTVQPEGKVLKLIETARARESAIPIYGDEGGMPPRQDQYVTRILRMEFVGVDEVKAVLDRLKSKDADISVYKPTNTLVITDLGTNIRRMEKVIAQLDVPMGGEKIWLIKLQSLAATEVATMLQTVFGVGAKAGAAGAKVLTPAARGKPATKAAAPSGVDRGGDVSVSQIIPDDRQNVLIVVATEKAYQRILALVKRLDSPVERGEVASDRVHVLPLANANAEEVAGTLATLGATGARFVRMGGPQGRPQAMQPQSPTSPSGQSSIFEGDVRVAADKPTNTLVVLATGRDYLTVRDIVRKLDIPRRQVFVEATILEISIDKARTLGFTFHGGDTVGSGDTQSLVFGGSFPAKDFNSLLLSPAALSGLAAGLRGPPIPGADKILGLPPGTSIPAFGVFMQALQNNGDVNVVSMPHILTTDNEKATIQVGQNLPFPGALGGFPSFGGVPGAAGASAALPGLATSVQRQDVALKLEITPHVNDSDFVRLEIDNELSDVANPNFNGLGPSTSKRHVKSTVTIRDQQTIVLGGLIKDRVSEQVDKIPLLGDIPILGYLFKKTNKTIIKQNLLIVLTPYIIKDPADLRRIFERKIRERREFLERYSAFRDDRDYEAEVDYRRKRGLLEEINRTAIEAAREAEELRAAEMAMGTRDIEGEVPLYVPTRSTLPAPELPPEPGAPPEAAPEPPPPPPLEMEMEQEAPEE